MWPKCLVILAVLVGAVAPIGGFTAASPLTAPSAQKRYIAENLTNITSLEASVEEIETLKNFINAGDHISFNNFFAMDLGSRIYGGEVPSAPIAEFLIELWEKRIDRHPELNWDIANSNRFRILFAIEILLAVRDWGLKYDTRDVHDYARAMALNDKMVVVISAFTALSIKGDESDVPFIKKLVSNRDFIAFRSAVRTLGSICHSDAERTLEELARFESEEKRKQWIEETLDNFYRQEGDERRRCR